MQTLLIKLASQRCFGFGRVPRTCVLILVAHLSVEDGLLLGPLLALQRMSYYLALVSPAKAKKSDMVVLHGRGRGRGAGRGGRHRGGASRGRSNSKTASAEVPVPIQVRDVQAKLPEE